MPCTGRDPCPNRPRHTTPLGPMCDACRAEGIRDGWLVGTPPVGVVVTPVPASASAPPPVVAPKPAKPRKPRPCVCLTVRPAEPKRAKTARVPGVCRRCGYYRVVWSRGLCHSCFTVTRRNNTFEEYALPRVPGYRAGGGRGE